MAIPTNKSIKSVTYNGTTIPIAHNNQSKSTTTNGTITPDSGYDGLSSVTVNVPTGTARSSADLTVSGATVSVPSGLYSSNVSKSVASGSAGTPTASKSTVSNNSVTVTPSVTNTTGYITGGTKTGNGVSVSASELVSGNKSLSSSTSAQTNIDVTNYATVSVSAIATGSAGTPTATKGTVSNHSVSITPSVTNTTGYITGGTKTGSAVSVSASELVSGTANIVTNGSVDVTNLSSASVNVPASNQTVKFYDYRTWDLTNCRQYGATTVDENWTNNIGTTGVSVGDLILLDITGKDSSGADASYQNIIRVTSMNGIQAHGDVIAQVKKGETLALTYTKQEQTKSQSITANGSYTISPDSGKVLSSASVSVNVPASAVTSGTKSITTTGTVDVTTYKNAQVSDANLIASNILSGVSILGVAGSYKPKYIDFGTFTPSSATSGVTVNHNLGVKPQLVIIIKKTSSHAQAGYVSMISVSQDSNKKFFYYGSAGYSYSNSPSNKQLGYGAGGLDTTDESSTSASYKTWGGAYAATSTTFKVARPAESIILDAVEYYYIAIAGVE